MKLKKYIRFDKRTVAFLILMLGVMAVIFYFSHQPGPKSSALSGNVAGAVGLKPSGDTAADTVPLFAGLSLRKYAHVLVYMALGGAAALFYISLINCKGAKRYLFASLFALVTGVLYAVSDEVHQIFVEYRFFTVKDILIDSLGVVIALPLTVGLWLGIVKIRNPVIKKRNTSKTE